MKSKSSSDKNSVNKERLDLCLFLFCWKPKTLYVNILKDFSFIFKSEKLLSMMTFDFIDQ
jgi:hypothetical protein